MIRYRFFNDTPLMRKLHASARTSGIQFQTIYTTAKRIEKVRTFHKKKILL